MPRLAIVALIVGAVAVSTAPPLILLAEIPPFALAAWRLLGVAAVLSLLIGLARLARGGRPEDGPKSSVTSRMSGRDRALLILSGVMYGAHFGLFNLAFEHTSKESVVVLLAVQPLLAALIGTIWLSEPITRRMVASSAVAFSGLLVFVWHDYRFDAAHLLGDGIVLVSGLVIVISYSVGRRLRPKMSLMGYLLSLYWIGGLACLALAVAVGDRLFDVRDGQWLWLAAMIVLPTLIGHSLFHYVIRYVPVFYVNLAILGEPILALLMMYALRTEFAVFRESTLTLLQVIGGALLLTGVAVGILRRRKVAVDRESRVLNPEH